MLKRLILKYKTWRLNKLIEENNAAIRDPKVFSPEVREYLKNLFPKEWIHESNISQLNLFKIAFTMGCMGYPCNNMNDLAIIFRILLAQNIFVIDPTNPTVIKRAV